MPLAKAAVATVRKLKCKKNPLRDHVWTVFDRDGHPHLIGPFKVSGTAHS